MRLHRGFYGFLSFGITILVFANAARAEVKLDFSSLEIEDECRVAETCIDEYLWSLYERTQKIDTVKISETKKVKVKRKDKVHVVTITTTKFVTEDYTWKDPAAAKKMGLSVKEYVIGGMDQKFRVTLYHALHALDNAGLMPGITSAFRDDYRQSIATGHKAKDDCSYHGGSRHGGYGHGLAADIVSVKGKTRDERSTSSEVLWKWVDKHGKELGIGRPYLDKDPPHVAPIEGKEYVGHRGGGEYVACGDKDKSAPADIEHQSSRERSMAKCRRTGSNT
jgi:hypothetical protein